MRIATWNLNDVQKRLGLLLSWLEVTKPDVVALQELKCEASSFPNGELAQPGYRIYSQKTSVDNALLQPDARALHANLIEQGWRDSLRKVYRREPIHTFWDCRRNRWQRDAGLRIDHLLLSRSLKPRSVAAGVDREVRGMENASDLAPAWVELS